MNPKKTQSKLPRLLATPYLSVHPLFIVFIASAFVLNFGTFALALLFAVLVHELGHIVTAKYYGIRPSRLRLLPFGAELSIDCTFLPSRERIIILLSGPFANIMAAILFGSLLWLFPGQFITFEILIFANAIPAVINLLPIYPLDGGKILFELIRRTRLLSLIQTTSTAVFIALILFGFLVNFNPALIIMAAMMIIMLNLEFKHNTYTSKFNTLHKKGGPVTEITITPQDTLFDIYKRVSAKHYTKFIIRGNETKPLYENDLEILLLKFPPHTKLIDTN